LDFPNVLKDRHAFSARGAGLLGFSQFGSDHTYALQDGALAPDWSAIEGFLSRHSDERILLLNCGGGLFFETEIEELKQLKQILSAKDQTISYFGFNHACLADLAVTLPSRAVDRIVPIGKALEFSTTWDGTNLLRVFSREIDLR
jgi:hypothetical protein